MKGAHAKNESDNLSNQNGIRARLRIYFDKILDIVHDFIAEYDEDINTYYEEHGADARVPEGE